MHFIVCVKQVPNTANVRVDPETNALVREGVESILNPFDENAIEAALQLKEAAGGTVTVLTMGPPQAADVLRHGLAMGAEAAVLLSDRAFRGSDTLATAHALAAAVRKLAPYDLVLCGKQAIDGDTAQVGPGLAERLGLPQVTLAAGLEIVDGKLRVRRMLEDRFEVVETRLPAVVTVVKQINEPRLPGMKGVLRARRAEIPTWTAADIEADEAQVGFAGSPTTVVRVFTPTRRADGEMISGDAPVAAERLAAVIRSLNLGSS